MKKAEQPSEQRVGDWMQTFSGRRFYPLDPRAEEVCLSDIGHALALKCRFGGHCTSFYSVAEHCVIGSKQAETIEDQKAFLLHDAAEAYLFDAIRPIKKFLPIISQIEEKILEQICLRFGLKYPFSTEIKKIDNRMLATERAQLMAPTTEEWDLSEKPYAIVLPTTYWYGSKTAFMSRAAVLGIRD